MWTLLRLGAPWLLAMSLAGCDDTSDTAPEGPDPAAIARGEVLYAQYCDFCHGGEGEGYLSDNANALNQQDFLATATDDFLAAAIIHGRPGTPMSAWGDVKGGPLTPEDVNDVVALLRSWQTVPDLNVHSQVVEGSAIRGELPYANLCAGCHGAQGEGVIALSLNNPWFLHTASDGFIRHAIVSGRPGTTMPAFGDSLRTFEINDMVALIRSWAVPVDGSGPPPFIPDLSAPILNPEGDAPTFTLRDGLYAPAAEVKAAIDEGERLVLVDARPTADYLTGHIEGAVSIPFYEVASAAETLPRDATYITYCGCPHAVSTQAANALLEAGFETVVVLDEGYYFWVDQGWPVEVGPPTD